MQSDNINDNWKKDRICVALDLDDKENIINIVDELAGYVGFFKLNFAFTKYGPKLIEMIKKRGGKVFLDLKFHDIPNTVEGYARMATSLGVDIFNVHASGGSLMMKSALKGAKEVAAEKNIKRPIVTAVTLLTSINLETMNSELNISGTVENQVLSLARMTQDAGLDGIVCSGQELEKIKPELKKDFFYITPGIRTSPAKDDQKRVYTPKKAIENGSSLIVVGRDIINADNRAEAVRKLYDEIEF
ncbi:MAG: orotidine-5'-phosphate decarboxylase [Candidatus Nanoarchaeia archaeon]